jgi:hypothetical protein
MSRDLCVCVCFYATYMHDIGKKIGLQTREREREGDIT